MRPSDREQTSGYRVHLNLADHAELTLLPGLGPKTARGLQDHRSAIGGFTSFDQLEHVPRIGPLTVAKMIPFLTLEP